MTLAMTRTLVLDVSYAPHRVVSWQRAAQLLNDGRAEVVELYDDVLRAISREAAKGLQLTKGMRAWFEMGADSSDPDVLVVKMPAVIRLLGTLGRKKVVKFSRINVLTRDNFSCCYCGDKKAVSELNYDHVVPRSRGGKTVWENIVTSCFVCNGFKRNRTPEEAGMRLLKQPVRPKSLPIAALRMDTLKSIPELWHSWLYWNVELQP
jgi:5-methylcytosine-specific restriction endonuclease McrA